MYQSNALYLSGYADMFQDYVVFPMKGDPVLIPWIYPHFPAAKIVSAIPDIRWGGLNFVEGVANRVKELGLERGRLGIVGVDSIRTVTIPMEQYETLRQMIPNAHFEFVTEWFEKLKRPKSDEELKFYEKGGEMTDAALEGLVKATRPGAKERDLFASLVSSAIRSGGTLSFALLSSCSMKEGGIPYPLPVNQSNWSVDRVIQRGDIVQDEISVQYSHCAGQCIRPIAVGKPTKEYEELFDVGLETYKSIQKVLKPGKTDKDVLEAAKPIIEGGYAIEAPFIHGWDCLPQRPELGVPEKGLGYKSPYLVYYPGDSSYEFVENQLIMIEPNPCTPDRKKGVFLGSLQVVTENGGRSLQKYPMEFVQV